MSAGGGHAGGCHRGETTNAALGDVCESKGNLAAYCTYGGGTGILRCNEMGDLSSLPSDCRFHNDPLVKMSVKGRDVY